MTNLKGGYKSLIVYWIALEIYDLTVIFCNRFIDKKSRTHDQMVQAARSGKQNIVEGSLEPSVESNIKLTGVARASYGELLEDYQDYLRQNNLSIWAKDDERVIKIRKMRINPNESNESNKSNLTNLTYGSYLINGECFANLMLTFCFKEGYLLDQLVRAQQEKFIKTGGFRENLFQKRIEYKKRNFY
ncbi:MAG: four helix bundle suffix domain-containing protein [Patescibacteria group bacterium]